MGTAYCAVLFRFEGNAEEIRSEVHSMQQQVRVLASEKQDLHHHLHSEQHRSRQHHSQVVHPCSEDTDSLISNFALLFAEVQTQCICIAGIAQLSRFVKVASCWPQLATVVVLYSIPACHTCTTAMLIISVAFQS